MSSVCVMQEHVLSVCDAHLPATSSHRIEFTEEKEKEKHTTKHACMGQDLANHLEALIFHQTFGRRRNRHAQHHGEPLLNSCHSLLHRLVVLRYLEHILK